MYIAVLSSLLMPMTCLSFGILAKYALVDSEPNNLHLSRKLTANDFTFSYFLVMFTTSLVISSIYFSKNPADFNMDYFIPGTIGSGLNVIACLFMNTAVSTGQPLGPIFALQMS